MAIECIRTSEEKYRGGESPSGYVRWHVRDLEIPDGEHLEVGDAYQAIAAESETAVDVYGAGSFFTIPRSNIDLSRLDDQTFEAVVNYGTKTQPLNDSSGNEAVDSRTRFRIAPRSVKITKSLETINTYDAIDASTPGNVLKGILNATPDGVEGLDIDDPVATLSLTVTKPRSFVTRSWLRSITRLIRHAPVNDSPFIGFQAGELRIMGADIAFTDAGNVDITFEFGVAYSVDSQNPIVVSDALTISSMEGWDYLQTQYRIVKRTVGGITFLAREPRLAAIERVYGRGDLSITGLS